MGPLWYLHSQKNLPIDWEIPAILETMSGKSKLALHYNVRPRESLYIAMQNTGLGRILNEDQGRPPPMEVRHIRAWYPPLSRNDVLVGGRAEGFCPFSALLIPSSVTLIRYWF